MKEEVNITQKGGCQGGNAQIYRRKKGKDPKKREAQRKRGGGERGDITPNIEGYPEVKTCFSMKEGTAGGG